MAGVDSHLAVCHEPSSPLPGMGSLHKHQSLFLWMFLCVCASYFIYISLCSPFLKFWKKGKDGYLCRNRVWFWNFSITMERGLLAPADGSLFIALGWELRLVETVAHLDQGIVVSPMVFVWCCTRILMWSTGSANLDNVWRKVFKIGVTVDSWTTWVSCTDPLVQGLFFQVKYWISFWRFTTIWKKHFLFSRFL